MSLNTSGRGGQSTRTPRDFLPGCASLRHALWALIESQAGGPQFAQYVRDHREEWNGVPGENLLVHRASTHGGAGVKTEPLVALLEGTDDPPSLSRKCPTCETEAGIWCAVGETLNYVGVKNYTRVRIGYIHAARDVSEIRTRLVDSAPEESP